MTAVTSYRYDLPGVKPTSSVAAFATVTTVQLWVVVPPPPPVPF